MHLLLLLLRLKSSMYGMESKGLIAEFEEPSYEQGKHNSSEMAWNANHVTHPKPDSTVIVLDKPLCKQSATRKWLRENALLLCTMAGVLTGGVIGFSLRSNMKLSEDAVHFISYPGEIFMRILKLLILPLVISSIISCCASLNARLNGKMAARTFIYFALTSLFNACLGISLAILIKPGGMNQHIFREISSDNGAENTQSPMDAFLDIGRNIFPDNIVEAFFLQAHTKYAPQKSVILENSVKNESNMTTQLYTRVLTKRDGTNNIGIITICLIFGTVLGTLESESSSVVAEFFRTIYQVVMKIMAGVMWLTPLGICSVICGKVLSVEDIGVVVSQLGWFVLTVVSGVLLYQMIFMQFIYLAILKKNPYKFYWGLFPGMLTAFATASTAAALPVTFECIDKQGVDKRVSRYILPIGCSINMDGTALFLGAAAVFIAQLNDISLNSGNIATLILVCTAGSMSSASVPSAALVLMLMVLSSIGCPVEDVSLLFTVDWLVDRCRTTNNMLGDCYAAAVVQHYSNNELPKNEGTTQKEGDEKMAKDLRSKSNQNGTLVTPL